MADNKLFPPIVDNLTPSFCKVGDNFVIKVPYQNNRSVSDGDFAKMALKIRTVINDAAVGNDRTKVFFTSTWSNGEAIFSIPTTEEITAFFKVGQFYKLQLAYGNSNNEVTSYYSTVTIGKFTTLPYMQISDGSGTILTPGQSHVYEYIGHYSQTNSSGNPDGYDSTEKVYSYRFILRQDSNILYDTGWLEHNAEVESQNLQEYQSEDKFTYYEEINPRAGDATIQYQVMSNNGGQYSTAEEYTITGESYVEWEDAPFEIELDQDNGYVTLINKSESDISDFYVLRESYGSNLAKIFSTDTLSNPIILKDNTVEQGITYSYYFCYEDDGTKYKSTNFDIYVDYEDIFLSQEWKDGDINIPRQLKVRFNPTISAIHETLLEQKVDTIGGHYPIFNRNGAVRYRDFQIGGVVTLQMDEQRLFSPLYGVPEQPARERTQTSAPAGNEYIDQIRRQGYSNTLSDYTPDNYYNERKFREEVYAWLTNGEIKLFRSSSEGILLVRLMNVNMVPFNGTSRMVYNFTAQVYEAIGHDYEDLVKNGFYKGVG